ncbi:MAG: transcriptional repressor LexA [Candidatus Marinimicrobia bacterium]|nr:transcriptional repressor LexA [Candidatus Neomarinimicrobiota bacterium]
MYLTKRQREILDFLKIYISKHGYSPTFQEIAKQFNFSSKGTVYKHLLNLKEKGFITKSWNKSRSIELTSDIAEMAIVQLPLLGYVKAGQPIEAITEYNTMAVPSDLVRKGRHYVLMVKGDSMIEEHIRDGDFVIVKEQQAAENGEVVIALVGGTEVTIKKFYRENGSVRLQPANADLEPLILPEESVAVQGIVVGILRKFI